MDVKFQEIKGSLTGYTLVKRLKPDFTLPHNRKSRWLLSVNAPDELFQPGINVYSNIKDWGIVHTLIESGNVVASSTLGPVGISRFRFFLDAPSHGPQGVARSVREAIECSRYAEYVQQAASYYEKNIFDTKRFKQFVGQYFQTPLEENRTPELDLVQEELFQYAEKLRKFFDQTGGPMSISAPLGDTILHVLQDLQAWIDVLRITRDKGKLERHAEFIREYAQISREQLMPSLEASIRMAKHISKGLPICIGDTALAVRADAAQYLN